MNGVAIPCHHDADTCVAGNDSSIRNGKVSLPSPRLTRAGHLALGDFDCPDCCPAAAHRHLWRRFSATFNASADGQAERAVTFPSHAFKASTTRNTCSNGELLGWLPGLRHAAAANRRVCGASARPSGRSSPPSSKSTMPLHSRLQPCSGWPAMTRAAARAMSPTDGHCGSWVHMVHFHLAAVGLKTATAAAIDQSDTGNANLA